MTPLLSIGSLYVTPYSLMILAGALAGILLAWRKQKIRPLLPSVILGALIVGHLVWVLFCPYEFEADEGKLWMILRPWQGGYTLYGALLGGALGALIAGKVSGVKWAEALDALAPGACAVIVFARIGEVFTGEGFGQAAEVEWTHFFPMSFCSYSDGSFEEWTYIVWFWEALAALILLIALLRREKKALPGHQAALFLTGLGTSQILLEQMRRDYYLRIIVFVRVTQLAALITLVALFITILVREKPGAKRGAWGFATLLFASLAVMFVEFVFDKLEYLPWLNMTMIPAAIACAGMLMAGRGRKGILPAALVCAAAAALLICYNLRDWDDSDLEAADLLFRSALLYGAMALNLICIGLSVECTLNGRAKA